MHAITGFFVVILFLHLMGVLKPLFIALCIVVILMVLYGMFKLIQALVGMNGLSIGGRAQRSSAGISDRYERPSSSQFINVPQSCARSFSASSERINQANRQTIDISRDYVMSSAIPASEHVQKSSSTRVSSQSVPITGLIIRPEPLKKILAGEKTWEMRSRTCRKREVVALIEKGGRKITGLATISGVQGPLTDAEMRDSYLKHRIELSRLNTPEVVSLRYAWELTNIRAFNSPISYSPRNGAVTFVALNEEECRAIANEIKFC